MKPLLCLLALAGGVASYAAQAPHPDTFSDAPDSVAHTYAIDDVVVKGKNRIRRIGRNIESRFFSTGPIYQPGDEIGIPCNAGKRTWKLGKLHLYCYTEQTDTAAFRLRLYKMADGKVGDAIPIPEIPIPVRDSAQFATIDLSGYDLRVTGDFLLAVECSEIRAQGRNGGVYFNARLGSRTFYRDKKSPDWIADRLGVGISVEAAPAPPDSGVN